MVAMATKLTHSSEISRQRAFLFLELILFEALSADFEFSFRIRLMYESTTADSMQGRLN